MVLSSSDGWKLESKTGKMRFSIHLKINEFPRIIFQRKYKLSSTILLAQYWGVL